jgi:hypothetical protein
VRGGYTATHKFILELSNAEQRKAKSGSISKTRVRFQKDCQEENLLSESVNSLCENGVCAMSSILSNEFNQWLSAFIGSGLIKTSAQQCL